MTKKQKSWQEKLLDSKDLPKIVKINPKMANRLKAKIGDTLLIPSPIEVDEIMKKVPKGKLITINEIRQFLARKHNATICCPLTTGIFSWIAAYAAEEAKTKGNKDITPYWRTLKTGGEINPKYPGGTEVQKVLLEKEGHKIIKKGKRYFVLGFEKYLVKL